MVVAHSISAYYEMRECEYIYTQYVLKRLILTERAKYTFSSKHVTIFGRQLEVPIAAG